MVLFCSKNQDSYEILSKRKIRAGTSTVSYNKKSYVLNLSKPSCSKGLFQYYYLDITKAEGQMLFGNHKEPVIPPEVLDMLIEQHAIKDLSSDLTGTALKINIILSAIFMVFGGFVGYVIGHG